MLVSFISVAPLEDRSVVFLSGFPQHIMRVVIHALPHGRAMASTMVRVFPGDVPGDRQSIIPFLVSLSVPLRRLDACASRAIRDTDWPRKSAVWTRRL